MNQQRLQQIARQGAAIFSPPQQEPAPAGAVNDGQILGLIASQLEGTAQERVDLAVEILAEVIVKAQTQALAKAVHRIAKARGLAGQET